MRKSLKPADSVIRVKNLEYILGNHKNNRKLKEILLAEQKNFCAYTDEYISRTDACDVEHFNPTLKDTLEDNYENWFVVKHQWNNEKSYKWENFQPILHPVASDFEERLIYLTGDYLANDNNDKETKNLISLLNLDDPILADKRKKYIARKQKEITSFNLTVIDFFTILIGEDVCQISYPRAIKEEFGFDILQLL